MTPQTSHPELRRSTPRSGLVVAAIGFQLLLCSIASAAGACSDTLDRSARRLPGQVAQVFREIVDRRAGSTREPGLGADGFTLGECALGQPSTAPRLTLGAPGEAMGLTLLCLPPPGAC